MDCTSKLLWMPLGFVTDVWGFYGFANYTKAELEKIDTLRHVPEHPPDPGKFISAAPALLVALLDVVLEAVNGGAKLSDYETMKVRADDLMERASKYCEEEISGHTHESP